MEKNDVRASIMGAVVADALGVPYEFSSRQARITNPATDMTGYGTHHQPVGTWSDDSSLTLATMDSLKDGLDYEDMMNKFCQWYFDADYTAGDIVFDSGVTTTVALLNYRNNNCKPVRAGGIGSRDNGNGSLMRIMPAILYLYNKDYLLNKKMQIISNISSLTHAHRISTATCNIYNFIACEILDYKDKRSIQECINMGIYKSRHYYEDKNDLEVLDKLYKSYFTEDDQTIASRGFVVDTLIVALYSLYYTKSYREAVLKAVNYGGDTDTNALVTGALAGLYYGYDDIPNEWIDTVIRKDYILDLCDQFYESIKE